MSRYGRKKSFANVLDFNHVRLSGGPRLPNFPGPTSEGETAYNLINSLTQTRRVILTTEHISLIKRCDGVTPTFPLETFPVQGPGA